MHHVRLNSLLYSLFFAAATNAAGAQTSLADSTLLDSSKLVTQGRVFLKIEQEASFKGGKDGWLKYLSRNLDSDVAQRSGMKPGRYTVVVQFTIDTTGDVTDVKVVAATVVCTACIKEAIRVVQASPKWQPALQSGRRVKYTVKQNILFTSMEW